MLETHRNSTYSPRKLKSQKPLKIGDPLRVNEKIEVKDVCPSCHSIYINNKFCESCGLQFWVDVIGEPFGPRSFFTLRDDFEAELDFADKVLRQVALSQFTSSKKAQKYYRHMVKRYNDLVEYLCSFEVELIPVENHDDLKVFLFEAKEVIKEVALYEMDFSGLYISLREYEDHRFAKELATECEEAMVYKKSSENLLWTIFKGGVIPEAIFAFVAIVLASFLVMKYLLT